MSNIKIIALKNIDGWTEILNVLSHLALGASVKIMMCRCLNFGTGIYWQAIILVSLYWVNRLMFYAKLLIYRCVPLPNRHFIALDHESLTYA